jgi:hypothetical protein
MIRDCYKKEDSRAMAFFGRLFEKYIQDITLKAVQGEYKYIDEFSYMLKHEPKKSSDAYIRKGNALLAVEAKGFSVLLDCLIKNERVQDNNKKLFVNPIVQADKCLHNVLNTKKEFDGVESVYIVSVTMDNINAVPNYYDEIYTQIEQKKKCDKVICYFNLNIEEYEMLVYLLEQRQDIFTLLEDYYKNNKLKPFSNYLHDSYSHIGMTAYMDSIYKEASEMMKDMLFPE